jgi:hypothetical protein
VAFRYSSSLKKQVLIKHYNCLISLTINFSTVEDGLDNVENHLVGAKSYCQ